MISLLCITPTVIPSSFRLKLSTTAALRNHPRAACTSSGFPNPKCQLMRLPCALKSLPSPSLWWKVILWRTWLELLPRNPLMFRCGLKSQVLPLLFIMCMIALCHWAALKVEALVRTNTAYMWALAYNMYNTVKKKELLCFPPQLLLLLLLVD